MSVVRLRGVLFRGFFRGNVRELCLYIESVRIREVFVWKASIVFNF